MLQATNTQANSLAAAEVDTALSSVSACGFSACAGPALCEIQGAKRQLREEDAPLRRFGGGSASRRGDAGAVAPQAAALRARLADSRAEQERLKALLDSISGERNAALSQASGGAAAREEEPPRAWCELHALCAHG